MWRTGAAWLLPWIFCLTARGSGEETPPKVPSSGRWVTASTLNPVLVRGAVQASSCGVAAAGLHGDVQQVQQSEESEGGQLLRPESHAVPGVHPQHPAALLAAGPGRRYGKNAAQQLARHLSLALKPQPRLCLIS